MVSLFQKDLLYNCLEEEVWVYYLPEPLDKEFENFVNCFGKLKYPLGEGYSFIKLETKDFLLTGVIGFKELRFTIKHGTGLNITDLFENRLEDYLESIFKQEEVR